MDVRRMPQQLPERQQHQRRQRSPTDHRTGEDGQGSSRVVGRASGGAYHTRRTLTIFTGAMVGGTALAALVLLPFGELLWHSADIHQRAGTSIDVHTDRKYL